jgi:hypothetical protein
MDMILFYFNMRVVIAHGTPFKPSEKRHEEARGASRLIKTRHAPGSPSQKCRFPRLENEAKEGGSRWIVITYINRILCNLWAGLISSSFRLLIKNKLYSGTGYCMLLAVLVK